MTLQDWIAAGVALLAFYWLLWRFGVTGWVARRLRKSTPAEVAATPTAGGCAKCADD